MATSFALDVRAVPHAPTQDLDPRKIEFGRIFTPTWLSCEYRNGKWGTPVIDDLKNISLHPAAIVLHYGQAIFEGLKAYRHADGSVWTFRPEANALRFQRSAYRLALPPVPTDVFIGAIEALVRQDSDWVPGEADKSLYLRPLEFGTENVLGVRPSDTVSFVLMASPVGAYFPRGVTPVKVWISDDFVRAAPGGTGAAKCGGNYAASLLAQAEATRHGCDQVVFLDAVERRWVEELGGMNIFFVFEDGSMSTPPLSGTILPGITRSSLLALARDKGITVREERYGIDQWKADAKSGKLREAFACGTAAVVTPIGTVRAPDGEFRIGNGGPGLRTEELKKALVDIQRCRATDPHNWIHKVF